MKILADLHHQDLYHSLQLLFETRLNAELYRPIGLEWYEEKYWHVYPHVGTARQYLALDQATERPEGLDGPYPDHALMNKNYRYEDGIYYVTDPTKAKVQRGITLDKFKEMDFDILISSIPQHIHPFNDLIKKYQPKAKHIFQVGNAWGAQPGVRNILASTAPFPVFDGINVCFYHQEFNLEDFHYEEPCRDQPLICSYIHYMKGQEVLNQVMSQLPDWEMKTFGAGMQDNIAFTPNIAKQMQQSAFTWHYKPEGDGMGHIIHDSYACGRPAIIWGSHYRGKLAESLFSDLETCINVENHGVDQVVHLINGIYHSPEIHQAMCKAAYNRFCEVVNYDREEKQIRKFLERLV